MTQNKTSTRCSTALRNQYQAGITPVIPDIKCKSPGEGDLLRGRDPVAIAKRLAEAGVPMLSVVTEREHFGGSEKLLERIAESTGIPVLRKDFITTRKHLLETLDIGAQGVLLIASMLEKQQLFRLFEEAVMLGLEPLVETHSREEILSISGLDLTFLGINNRNIQEWELDGGDVGTTEELAGLVSPGTLVVSESSISSPGDVKRALKAGAHAVLVGTAILQAADEVEMYRSLSHPWR